MGGHSWAELWLELRTGGRERTLEAAQLPVFHKCDILFFRLLYITTI